MGFEMKSNSGNYLITLIHSLKQRIVQPRSKHSYFADYVIAFAFIGAALIVRLAMAPVNAGLQYVTFFPAVTLAVLICGFWPGIFAAIIGASLSTYIFTAPYYSLSNEALSNSFWSNIVFLFDGLVVCTAIECMHHYGLEVHHTRRELERHQKQLEVLVVDRTQEIAALNAELESKATDAESANRAKSVFLATMSHEIRTPLNAVVGLTGLLADSPLDRRQRDYVDKVQLSAQVLRALIDNILDFSKIEAGVLRLEQAPFSLDAILRTTAAIISVGKSGKPIEALFDVERDIPDALIGDALRLQQILLNLTGNAVKFTETGEIVVSVRCLAKMAGWVTLQFAVRDTGIGIPPEQLSQIFEVFVQGDFSISRKYGGSGLGLAISARLADLMGGRINVDSVLGQGSEFRFTVTLALADSEPAAPQEESLSGLNILIIDDHPLARDILKKTCATFGWKATALHSGVAGLDELRRSAVEGHYYDLMLLDWRMPGMDGIEMLRQAQATPDIGLPFVVLMVSTFELEQAIAASDDLYLDGIVAKPVTPSTLFEAVKRAYSGELNKIVPSRRKTDRRLYGMRLLVAEDNDLNQQMIEDILTRAGAEVVITSNGLAAVKALQAPDARFDAVLMDIQMPVMDGYTATRIIREEMGRVDLPIIAVTAHARPEDREKSLDAGMVAHIVKPIDVEDLLDILGGKHRGSMNRFIAESCPTSEATEAAIQFSGLNVTAALKTFGGNALKYGEALRKFFDSHSGDTAEASRLFSTGDKEGALKLVHDMLGMAGILRATEVARLAASTQEAIMADNAETVPLLFDELQAAMLTLGESIDQFNIML
jgi:two-component system sensor histidine kinase/response regulator